MKLHLMDFGELTMDQGWFLEGAGTSTLSNPNPENVGRKAKMMGILIEHPKHGLILYEVGPGPNYKELCPGLLHEMFPITSYTDENRLDRQLKKVGYNLKDVSAIVLGHMHIDHAGGLELFSGTDVPIYVHELELKYAFYAVATKQDYGAYLPYYIDPSLNWKAIEEPEFELFEGITVYHTPGHTPGCMAMKVDLKNTGPFVLTTDTFFFKENYDDERAQGWLIRDRLAWWRSLRKIKNIVARCNAHVIFGHDPEVFVEYSKETFYD